MSKTPKVIRASDKPSVPLVEFRRFGTATGHSRVHFGTVPQLQASDRAEHRARKQTHKPRYSDGKGPTR